MKDLSVSGEAPGLVGHAGAVWLRALAARVGLTAALSKALTRAGFTPVHDRGQVLTDLAIMIVLGGTAISDMRIFTHLAKVLGPVASYPTAWRTLNGVGAAQLEQIGRARKKVRAHIWRLLAARPRGFPWLTVAGRTLTGWIVVDVDASVVVAHSDKQGATPTFKKTYGFHPIAVWVDNTREMLACVLRPGKAGSNTVIDHLAVLSQAVGQIPRRFRSRMLFRVDGAGATHGLLDWVTAQGRRTGRCWEYSAGFTMTAAIREAIAMVPARAWAQAIDADGSPRYKAWVVDITGMLDLSLWPAGMRVVCRRERPHPGARLTAFERRAGWRYQLIATNTQTGQIAWLEARHRAHARVEDKIRCAKDSGLSRLPSREFAVNTAWCAAVMLAADLTAWLQLLALDQHSDLARAEPKTLRYRILHVPARLVSHARRRTLRLPADWPWTAALLTAWNKIQALPLRT